MPKTYTLTLPDSVARKVEAAAVLHKQDPRYVIGFGALFQATVLLDGDGCVDDKQPETQEIRRLNAGN